VTALKIDVPRHRIASLPVGTNGVSPSVIRDRISATSARIVYLTTTFQNPTGSVMPRSARKEISRIASELGVPVIDDGALADLNIDGLPPPPLATDNPDALVLTIGSISKLICSGLRVGWVRAPEPIIQRLARLKSAMDLGSPLLTQAIAARLLGVVGIPGESERDSGMMPKRQSGMIPNSDPG
jgi:DNA-binding transcriptional MocR family regulator